MAPNSGSGAVATTKGGSSGPFFGIDAVDRRDAAAAEASYREAIAIAQQQSAKLWELRAAPSLAQLWRYQEKHAEARDLLAPVYGWFTEGFGTPVLQEAKALLQLNRKLARRPGALR